jgi:DNA-binding transcriptional MerR regulator
MDEQILTIGEVAKVVGVTLRTLQHYDNIGIVPASGRTEGGRRYYTESDIIKLEQVIFYRNLGFSLKQIKEKLIENATEDNAQILLDKQKVMLYNQIEKINNSISAIEACQEIDAAGKNPPWIFLSRFLQLLGNIDLSAWRDYKFSREQEEIFNEHLPTIDIVLELYTTWKKLSIKAAAYSEIGIKPDTEAARKLVIEWKAMVQKATGGKDEHKRAYIEVDMNREAWSDEERELIEKAEPYLEMLLKYHNEY